MLSIYVRWKPDKTYWLILTNLFIFDSSHNIVIRFHYYYNDIFFYIYLQLSVLG